MANDNGFRLTPNLVVGLAITAAGGVLLLERFGLVSVRDVLRFWPVLLILFGLSVVAQALQGSGPAGSAGARPRPIVTPGFVILLVVLGLVASNVVPRRIMNRSADGSTHTVFTVMSRTSRSSDAVPFRGADMGTLMGKSRLDLRDAILAPGDEAVVDILGLMGNFDIVVPEGWEVDVQAVPVMGRVSDRRLFPSRDGGTPAVPLEPGADDIGPDVTGAPPAADGPPPRLVVRGFIMMGAVNIES